MKGKKVVFSNKQKSSPSKKYYSKLFLAVDSGGEGVGGLFYPKINFNAFPNIARESESVLTKISCPDFPTCSVLDKNPIGLKVLAI